MENQCVFFVKKVFTPFAVLHDQKVVISNGVFESIEDYNRVDAVDYSFPDHVLYPALINAHDHLLGSYYPRVGTRRPYFTWKAWDDDLKSSDLYKERSHISNQDLYLLGAYKNLLSGVTTVSDHIPHSVNDPFISKMPIRVLKDYSLAHEVSSYDLKWGDGVEIEHERAVKLNQPFITHIEEGFDDESMKGIEYLVKKQALSEYTVLIHGIGLSDKDLQDIAYHKAHLVWCPFSNYYMFERTARIREALELGINVSIGTDSPMSGAINILEEMRFAKKIYKQMYNAELDDRILVEMVTVNPAKALRINGSLGEVAKRKKADFFLLEDVKDNVYMNLVEARLQDIVLLFYEGKPLYGTSEFYRVFELLKVKGYHFSLIKEEKIIAINDPKVLFARLYKALGFKKALPFFPIDY